MDTRRLIVLLIFIFSGYLLLQNWQDFKNISTLSNHHH